MPEQLTPEQISQILNEFFKIVGTRKYIGERYVPLFGRKGETSIEWDNTKPYEPLTIVLHEGNSYTSRQYVPVGVEITNQEFWALTGNYNAQIEQYRRETQQAYELAQGAQNDIDTLLPKEEFDVNNTVKHYIDTNDEILSNRILPFATVAAMKESNILYVGAFCYTSGFHSQGDNGGAYYVITGTGEANERDVISCGDLYANLIINDFVTPEMFGAKGDASQDASEALQLAIDSGLPIICNGRYLIENDVIINTPTTDSSHDVKNGKRTRIVGKSANVSLASTNATQEDFSELEATFLFDGGSFIFNGTSGVDFESCVFMGKLARSKHENAFILTAPARRLRLRDCTFVNLECGIRLDNPNEYWSGEHQILNCFFSLCEYAGYFQSAGYDSLVQGCVIQGSCDNGFIFQRAMNLLFTTTHDYSVNGSRFTRGANIVGNYFDGFGKLHLEGARSSNAQQPNRPLVYSGNVVANTFFIGSWPTVTEDKACIIAHGTTFMNFNISNNMINGAMDGNYKLALLDVSECNTVGFLTISNNTGENLQAIFKGMTTQSSYYMQLDNQNYNDVHFDVAAGQYSSFAQEIQYTKNGIIAVLRVVNPVNMGGELAKLVNVPPNARFITEITRIHSDGTNNISSSGANSVWVATSENDLTAIIAKIYVSIGSQVNAAIAYTI